MQKDEAAELILKDISFQIISAAFEVHNILSYGFLENVYHKSLVKELQSRGLRVEEQKEIKVSYKGEEVGTFYADILVNDEIVLELKALDNLSKAHEAQLLNYLKATGLKLGILINFGKNKVEFKRMVL